MFRFTIRDVLWLMVVVGMGVGWALHYVRHAKEREAWRRTEIDDAFKAVDTVNRMWQFKRGLEATSKELETAKQVIENRRRADSETQLLTPPPTATTAPLPPD